MDLKHFKARYEHVKVQEHQNNVSENPMVSICVQTYQHVDYIKACLDGILNQETNFSIEVLLGEDSSTDGTREICIEYAKKHPEKIRLFLHHRENNIFINGKPSGRFNFMFNLLSARGKYIALCEGDDYWTDPLKLQKQVDFLEVNQKVGGCFTNAIVCNEINQTKYEYNASYNLNEGVVTDIVIFEKGGGIYPSCTLVCHKNLTSIPDFIPEIAGDELLLFKIANNSKIAYLDFISATYNRWDSGVFSGIMNNRKKLINYRKNEIVGYKKLLPLLNDSNKLLLKNKMKKVVLYILKNDNFSLSNFKYIRLIGVKSFVKALVR